MRMVVVGGLLITLPAIVVVASFMGSIMMLPALASLFIAGLPFAVFAYVLARMSGTAADERDEPALGADA